MKSTQKKIYNWYLWISLIYSSISIFSSLYLSIANISTHNQLIAGVFLFPLILGIFAFQIVMFIIFLVNKIEKIALILPGLYIFDFIFSGLLGFFLLQVLGESAHQSLLGNLGGMVFPLITLFISIQLLKRV